MPDSNQVMSWAKISRRQLDNWVAQEYIKPTVHRGRGLNGVQYDWSVAEAKVIQRMGGLTAAGVAPAMAARFARGDRKALEALLYALKPCTAQLTWELAVAADAPN
jgi:hypothetical protein